MSVKRGTDERPRGGHSTTFTTTKTMRRERHCERREGEDRGVSWCSCGRGSGGDDSGGKEYRKILQSTSAINEIVSLLQVT